MGSGSEIWHNLVSMGEPYPEKIIRSIAVYLFLLVALRLAGKRELGSASTADLIVILLISNTVQNAIIGNETSLIGGLFGAAILLAMNWAIARIEYHHSGFKRLVEGTPCVLIRDGAVDMEALHSQEMTREELLAACRSQNVADFTRIKVATLETNGMITIVPFDPPDVVTERLGRIEDSLRELLKRTGSAPDVEMAR
jgi:uncharacterized membrane protein YcaP (DUF421 family)